MSKVYPFIDILALLAAYESIQSTGPVNMSIEPAFVDISSQRVDDSDTKRR
jgi:hypothetical protein